MPNIIRIWRGKTLPENADAYGQLMQKLAIPDYGNVQGLVSYRFTRAERKGYTEFLLLTEWVSYDAIKQFAGDDYTKAKYYPEDKDFLLDFPETVEHFEVFDTGQGI